MTSVGMTSELQAASAMREGAPVRLDGGENGKYSECLEQTP